MIGRRNCFRLQSIWRRIFIRSVVNGAMYRGDQLPRRYWDWPKDTYLQRRLKYLSSGSGRVSGVRESRTDLSRRRRQALKEAPREARELKVNTQTSISGLRDLEATISEKPDTRPTSSNIEIDSRPRAERAETAAIRRVVPIAAISLGVLR
jgi:hypothetical protein